MHGYWRHPTVGLPAILSEPPADGAVLEGAPDGTLAPELEQVTRMGLEKLGQILRLPTDPRAHPDWIKS